MLRCKRRLRQECLNSQERLTSFFSSLGVLGGLAVNLLFFFNPLSTILNLFLFTHDQSR